MSKNILFITVRADIGGGPKHLYQLLQELHKDPSYKLFIASPNDFPYIEKYKEISTKFILIPHRKFKLSSFIKLFLFCKKNKIELIHSHGFGAGIYSRLLSLFNINVIHTFHGLHIKNKIRNIIEKIFRPLTTFFIFVSNDELKKAKKINLLKNSNYKVINNGLNFEHINNLNKSYNNKDIRKEYNLSNELIIGTLSRLDFQKGNDLLINHFEALVINSPDINIKLIIAGDGKEKNSIKKQIKNKNLDKKTLLIGEVENPYKFLKMIDLYISCSRGEGLPYAPLEAIAMKKSCLLSRVSGHKNIIPDEYLFDLENFEESNNIILKLLKNSNSDQIYKKTKNNFNHIEMVEKIKKIYQKLIF